MRYLGTIVALSISVPASAADQFDLVCSGKIHYLAARDKFEKNDVFSMELRVDLKAKQYCYETCPSVIPIFNADGQNIEFEESYENDPVYGTKGHRVSRVTGEYSTYNFPAGGGLSSDWKGSCEVAPFKGFPSPQTKF